MMYSCDQCKNLGTNKCSRCKHTRDKKPSKFRPSKVTVLDCALYSQERRECSLIANIKTWNEEIKTIDEAIDSVKNVNITNIVKFFYESGGMCRVWDYVEMRMRSSQTYDNEILLQVISESLHQVSYEQLIAEFAHVNERDMRLTELRNQKSELEAKIQDAKRQLGIT